LAGANIIWLRTEERSFPHWVLKDEVVKYSMLVFMKLVGVIQDNGIWAGKIKLNLRKSWAYLTNGHVQDAKCLKECLLRVQEGTQTLIF
jgi:hypothetical protein